MEATILFENNANVVVTAVDMHPRPLCDECGGPRTYQDSNACMECCAKALMDGQPSEGFEC
jgi:hypothetical protein